MTTIIYATAADSGTSAHQEKRLKKAVKSVTKNANRLK